MNEKVNDLQNCVFIKNKRLGNGTTVRKEKIR